MDGKVARDREQAVLVLRDAIRFESQDGKFVYVEEIRALQVCIALRVAGLDRFREAERSPRRTCALGRFRYRRIDRSFGPKGGPQDDKFGWPLR
jgi:hypothetical protein